MSANTHYRIKPINWTEQLAYAIKDCEDGDAIIVSSDAMRNLGLRARQRLCPSKHIIFEVREHEK